jgi:hypothetical protein
MSEYLLKSLKELNIKQLENFSFEYFDFIICFTYSSFKRHFVDKMITVRDKETNIILQKFNKYDIGYDELFVTDPNEKEKMLLNSLIKIIANSPTFYKKRDELKNFYEIQNNEYLDFSNNSFSLNNFSVYKLYSETEHLVKLRVGKDDTYEITQITEWYSLYNGVIIETVYLRSLLPKKIINEYLEDVYGPTVIGEPTRIFKIDFNETLNLRKLLDMNQFFKT